MAIDFYDGTNHDGLFDVLGKLFKAQELVNTATGTTVHNGINAILTQAQTLADSLNLNVANALSSATTADASFAGGGTGAVSLLQQAASALLVQIVNADSPQADQSEFTAIKEVIRQMVAQSASVDASTVSASVAPIGSPVGDGVILSTMKSGDGRACELAIAEAINVTCVASGNRSSLQFVAPAAASILDASWPDGSGAIIGLTALQGTDGVLSNGEFDSETDYTNIPDDWIVITGTAGATILMTDVEVQTVAISGSPTSGYYLLHWTNRAGHTQTTAPIAFDADGGAVASALHDLTGLEGVTVETAGTSPNFTHTITFAELGGNVAQLTSTSRMAGGTSVNEKQRITISGKPDGGTFTLTYAGQTTAGIAFNASASTIATALVALSNIDAMTGSGGAMPNATDTDMTFGGSLAGTDVSEMTIDTSGLTKTAPSVTVTTTTVGGAGGVNEVQAISADGVPSGGTWTITWNGQTTSALAATANAAAVQAAMIALSNIAAGEVAVTGGTLGVADFVVTFQNGLGSANQPAMTVDDSSLSGPIVAVNVVTTTAGSAAANEVQVLTLYGTPTGGTFTLTFSGQTTSAIAYNASAATVQTALEALSNIAPGDVTCTGGSFPGTAITVTFGGAYANTDVPQISLSPGALTGGSISASVSTTSGGAAGTHEVYALFQHPAPTAPGGYAFEVQKIDKSGTVTGGTFKISLVWNNGTYVTDDIAYNATVFEIAQALNASGPFSAHYLSAIASSNPGSTLAYDGSIQISFVGYYSGDLPLMVIVPSLTGGGSYVVSAIVHGGNEDNLSSSVDFQLKIAGSDTSTLNSLTSTAAEIRDAIVAADGTANGVSVTPMIPGYLTSGGWWITFPAGTFTMVVNYSSEYPGVRSLKQQSFSGAGGDEIQRLTTSGSPSQGTFLLTFDGATIAVPLNYNATAAEVDTALENLSNIPAGGVTCTGGPLPTAIDIEFTGSLGNTDVPQISVNDDGLQFSATTTTAGDPGTDEVQRISASPVPVAGTFTLTWDDTGSNPQTTSALDFDATASEISAALIALSNIGTGDVVVSGGPINSANVFVHFANSLAHTDVRQITATSSLTGATPTQLSVVTTINGVAPSNETQSFTLGPDITGGTFTLSWNNGTSTQTTAAIPFDATAAQVRTALEATSTIAPGDVATSGGPCPAAVAVTFQGAYAGLNVNAMTGSGASLTQDAIVGTITTIQDGGALGGITHLTTVSGTPQVYSGAKALVFASNGSELTTIQQRLVNLQPNTVYGVHLWACCDSIPAAGVLKVELIDGTSGALINDDQGIANALTFNASALLTTWQSLDTLVSGDVVFRTPLNVPSIVYLRLRISSAVTSGKSVFFDRFTMAPMTQLCPGGPFVQVIGGRDAFAVNDRFTLTVANDRAGLVQEWFARNFNMAQLGMLLPSNSAGSETIPDSVVS